MKHLSFWKNDKSRCKKALIKWLDFTMNLLVQMNLKSKSFEMP